MNNGLVTSIAKCHESEETGPVELEGNRENTVAELSDNAIPSPRRTGVVYGVESGHCCRKAPAAGKMRGLGKVEGSEAIGSFARTSTSA
jgi:hypothetical protein